VSGSSIAEVSALLLRILEVAPGKYSILERSRIEEWDSLKHMELIFSVEERYGVQFDETEFMSLTSPAAIWSAVQKHLAT
jgi:acyl carrier protein